MNWNPSCAVATVSLLLLSPLTLRAQLPAPGTLASGSPTTLAEPTVTTTTATTTSTTTQTTAGLNGTQAAGTEIKQRRQLALSARQAVVDGQKLLAIEHYDEAADRFQYALDALEPRESAELYRRAQADLAAAKAGQARNLAADSKFAQAASRLQEAIALQPNDPQYTADLEALKQQQMVYEKQVHNVEGTVNNPAVTQDFRDKVATVQKLLFQGDAYFRTGQYERAEDTFSKVLILDPYNKAARDEMDHMERYRDRAANQRREEYRDEALLKVNQEWSEAISPDIVVPPSNGTQVTAPSNRAEINNKLQSIIIDKIDFNKLDVADVIQFLTAKSKELDPQHVGINFVLNLNTQAPPADTTGAAPSAATPSGPTATSTDTSAGTTGAGVAGGTPAAASTAAASGPIHRAVTIQLDNVPLSDVLGYIIQQTNLQYSVDDYAVYLRPSIDEGQTLTVRTFLAPPNFFTNSGGLRVSTSTTSDQPTTVEDISTNVQQELANRGIRFPPGATATFLPGSSKLVVRNTPEQLDLIANLIEQLSKETPQVQIEAKLADFTENALKSLSFNYEAGFHAFLNGQNASGFTSQTDLRDSNYTNSGIITGGLQPDSIDNLIQQNTATNSGTAPLVYTATNFEVQPNTPNVFTVGAVIDGIGFAAVINALNNNQGVDLISAPTVTTQDNLKANIDIVREFPYPTSFEKPKLSTSDTAYSSGEFANDNLVLAIPPTPREFVTQDIGVSLEVKPTTYPDQRIDLDITKASTIDFDGFIDYGSPILTKLAVDLPVDTLTPGTINQPVFEIRSVVTRIQILDGQTAVLGGLLREDTQEIHDKVPLLGDLPLLGRLFQSKVSSRIKRNLLIFITARLIRSNGKPQYVQTLNAEPEEEKLPEPPPMGPGVTLPPLSNEEPNS